MMCDMAQAAMQAGPEAAWPSGVVAHLTGCDACAAAAVELSLRHPPAIMVPPTFAVDVARRARLATPPERQRISGAMVGAAAAAVLTAIALASFGMAGGTPAAVPVAVLLLSAGEAIVLAAWTLHGDIVRARVRR
jgi:hypothetical protein